MQRAQLRDVDVDACSNGTSGKFDLRTDDRRVAQTCARPSHYAVASAPAPAPSPAPPVAAAGAGAAAAAGASAAAAGAGAGAAASAFSSVAALQQLACLGKHGAVGDAGVLAVHVLMQAKRQKAEGRSNQAAAAHADAREALRAGGCTYHELLQVFARPVQPCACVRDHGLRLSEDLQLSSARTTRVHVMW